ncbi:hypothetical protein BDR22DRAFT_884955 [Usnea florida]
MSERLESNVFTSPLFKFIVDGTAIYLHASLVSQHSKPLERMMNGHMAEAQQGFAVLKEVDEGTFTRFAQWAYSGYYTSAEHEVQPNTTYKGSTPAQDVTEYLPTQEEMKWEFQWPEVGRSRDSSKQYLIDLFRSKYEKYLRSSSSFRLPRPNENVAEDYTNVFLSHARVYVFADQYDVQGLKSCARKELHLALANYTLYPDRTGDIIALIRYIYSNTGESVSGVMDLRSVLKEYMSCEMDTLMKDPTFKELMFEDGGALLGDFMKAVQRKIEYKHLPDEIF